MSTLFGIVLVLAFIAGVLVLEGLYLLWKEQKGPDVQRLERRLRNLSAGAFGAEALRLLKRETEEAPWLQRLLVAFPRLSGLDRVLGQAGLDVSVSRFLLLSGASAAATALVVTVTLSPPFWFRLLALLGGAVLPYLVVARMRRKRLGKIEQTLPEAVDMISRALRAGHAFPSALQMVGTEMSGPIATEFRIVSEEVNYGVSIDAAFKNLATRVPSDDVRFFAIAVLLQRETGGNLAEVLQNIARLIRERFQLMGKVRVLSAEGRLSAYVLIGMPISTAAMLNLIHPEFMSTLWKDPIGLMMVYVCAVMMVLGSLWMWRIIQIRV